MYSKETQYLSEFYPAVKRTQSSSVRNLISKKKKKKKNQYKVKIKIKDKFLI